MLDGLSVIDPTGEQIYVNDAMCTMLGFSREELLGKGAPYPYWPVEQLPAIEAAFQRFVAGQSTNFELVFQRKDGVRFDVMVAPVTISDATGTVLARYATIKDISELKRLTRSLYESQERWRSIAENPFDFVVLIDRAYRYTYINHTAPGISHESLLGRATPFDFVDASHHDTMRAAFETAFETGRPSSYEVHVPTLDSWYSSIVGPVREHGQVTCLSILTREITDQKRAEQRLRESHKIETLGTLAGGIAHDINNMLTPILAYCDLATRQLPADHAVQLHLQQICAASQRASELVRRILLFSRRQEPSTTTFDLRDIVRDHTAFIRASLPATIELVIDVPDEPSYVVADRAQLGQVLANLATNALHAMQQAGGKLTIAQRPADGRVVLSVTDTGHGMDAETLRRAFDPFFTTKPVGSGTGLGLSIVHGVVREHGGEIEVRSAPGEGAAFLVHLPAAPAPGSATDTARPSPVATKRDLRVLVVDDEPMIAKVASMLLSAEGYVVTAVSSGQAALETFARDPEAFDVVLTDDSMPGMTGTALIGELRRIRPCLACVLMSGRVDDALHHHAASLDPLQIVAKPFASESLIKAIERAHASLKTH
jgi:two-component system, cell cycle sensor histidine kinase and response regulator CckA